MRRFEDVTAIVVTRYDRVDTSKLAAAAAARAAAAAANAAAYAAGVDDPRNAARAAEAAAEAANAAADARIMGAFSRDTPIYRVHQEDFCQSLRVHPSKKYQSDGGPGPHEIVDLLRANVTESANRQKRTMSRELTAADEDINTFVDALIFNWLIGGTDAHAKNFSILIGGGGLVRLAPLYDVASILAYPRIDPMRAKLAMKIGGEYRLRDVGWENWRQFATSIQLPQNDLLDRARTMAENLPDVIGSEVASAKASGLDHPVLDRLSQKLISRARHVSMT